MCHPLGFLIFRDSKAGMVSSTLGMCRYISHSEIVCRGPKKFENPCARTIKVRPHRTRSAAADCGLCPLPHTFELYYIRLHHPRQTERGLPQRTSLGCSGLRPVVCCRQICHADSTAWPKNCSTDLCTGGFNLLSHA